MVLHLKKNFFIVFVGLLISLSANAQNEHYEIMVIQDSVHRRDSNHVILLEKKPFRIQVELKELEGLYLFAAFRDSIYKLNEGQAIPGLKDLPAMSMAEEKFNPDKELIISDDGWVYWFYTPKEDWHRFDSNIRISGKQVMATKSVQQFYLSSIEKTIPVAEVVEPLYLFFISLKENKAHKIIGELQRYKIKIDWK